MSYLTRITSEPIPAALDVLTRTYGVSTDEVLQEADPRINEHNVIVYTCTPEEIVMHPRGDSRQSYDKFIASVIEINRSQREQHDDWQLRSSLSKSSDGRVAFWGMSMPTGGFSGPSICGQVIRAARQQGLTVCVVERSEMQSEIDQGHAALCNLLKSRREAAEARDVADQTLAAIREARTFDHVLSEQMISSALHQKIITFDEMMEVLDPAAGWLYRIDGVNVLVTRVYEEQARASVVKVRAGKREGEQWFIDLLRLKPVPLPLGSCGAWLKR